MIIFDLDGTLADIEHRCYLIDSEKNVCRCGDGEVECPRHQFFKPRWDAFFEACDKDKPNRSVIEVFDCLTMQGHIIEIWSGRSESVRQKTILWLIDHVPCFSSKVLLKMRPHGDSTPDDQLKEAWLDEALALGKRIELVFDDRSKVVKMWRRRGIPCFQVAEGDF